MQASILSLSQDLSLESGAISNFLVLALPGGSVIRARIESTDAETVTQAFVRAGGSAADRAVAGTSAPAMPAAPPLVARQEQPLQGHYSPLSIDGDTEFGGDYAPAAPVAEPVQERKGPRLVVNQDEFGNPVIQGGDRLDVQNITGGGPTDEDGVSSV